MVTRLLPRALSQCAAPRLTSRTSIRCRQLLNAQGRPRNARQYSTPPAEAEAPKHRDLRSQFSDAIPPRPPAQPKPKGSLRPYIWSALFISLGLLAGQYTRLVIAPPPLPAAHTREDDLMVDFLKQKAEQLPIVRSPRQTRTGHPTTRTRLYRNRNEYIDSQLAPLAGARAIGGFQRIFINKDTGETISVIWFGGAVAGWPGVTHGGVTATILDETLGRCAVRQFPTETGVTANLELNYLKPIITNAFYVIRAAPVEGHTDRKCWVTGRLETLDGAVCVEAKALFVVPKSFTTRVIASDF